MARHDAREAGVAATLLDRPWRQGRKVGRNVYAQVGDEPGDGDVLIGQFDTASLAHDAIWWHNQAHGFTQTDGGDHG